jgi:hypothetical protein
MRHRNESDTDTGLPRKTVNKGLLILVRSLIGLVCSGLVWCGHHLNQQLVRMEQGILESNAQWEKMNVRVARIEWKLNIVAGAASPAMAVQIGPPKPMP